MIKITENNIDIRNELLHLASSNLFVSSLAVIVNSIIIVIVFWNIADHTFLSFWLMSITTILLIRNIKAKQYLKNTQKYSIDSLEKTFKLQALITSAIISIGMFVLFPADKPFHQAFLAMIIAGLSAGTVMSLSTYKNLAINYLLILLVPFIFIMFKTGTDMNILTSLLATLFLMLLITFSKRHHEKIIELITSNMLVQESEKELKLSESYFSSIFKEVPIGVFTYNKDLIITEANRSISELLKSPIHKLINLDIKLLSDQSIRPPIEATLNGEKGYYEGNYHTQIANEEIWIKMQAVPMYDINNNIKGGLGIVEDITDRIQADEKIRHQAFFDHLTGLANRLTLNDRLEQQLARLARHNRYGSILFIDLDHFKTINDSLGHHIGDILLKTFAKRASNSR